MPYGKSSKSIQDSAFKMRSGNSTPFKKMGSSPLKQDYHEAIEHHKKYVAEKVSKAKKYGPDAVNKEVTRIAKGGKPKVDILAKKTIKKAAKKTLIKTASKVASRFLGPIGVVLTGVEIAKTIPKVVKATEKSLKKQAKTGQTIGFPKY